MTFLRVATVAGVVSVFAVVASADDALVFLEEGDIFVDQNTGTSESFINIGDTVVWEWIDQDEPHSTTSDTLVWDSGVFSAPHTFEFTFDTEGVYPYYCVLHGAPGGQGMAGTVTVIPAPGSAMLLGVACLAMRRRR